MAGTARRLLVWLVLASVGASETKCSEGGDSCPARSVAASARISSTPGLALLQARRELSTVSPPELSLDEEEAAEALACTPSGGDPYGSGNHVNCCGGLQESLGKHGGAHHEYFLCLPSGKRQSTSGPQSASCTAAGVDPYASGQHVGCCPGLKSCLGHHSTSHTFFLCEASCGGSGGRGRGSGRGGGHRGGAGWRPSGKRVGSGWCSAEKPVNGWRVQGGCGGGARLTVLSYNLFWWNLFGRRGGNGGSAGKLIAASGPFDVMGFQECEDVGRVLRDAGLEGSHGYIVGGHATAIAYNRGTMDLLASGKDDVAEDRPEQWYGRRGVGWARLRHRASGKTVFAVNHHGPLPVNTGGKCGGEATAYNMLRVIGHHAGAGDVKLLFGDLNAEPNSATQNTLRRHMIRSVHHWVDAIYSSCPAQGGRALGKGGSDHNAIQAVFRI